MPNWVKGKKDEELWKKAKKIVTKEYDMTEKDGEAFWKLVTGVYKRAGGSIQKTDETTDNLRRGILDALNEARKFVPKNDAGTKPTGKQEGDIIRITSPLFMDMDYGTYWKCISVPNTSSTGTQRNYYTFVKLHSKTFEPTESSLGKKLNFSGMAYIRPNNIDVLISNSFVLIPGKSFEQGMVTVEDVKYLIDSLGIDSLLGVSSNKVVTTRRGQEGIYIDFRDMKASIEDKELIFKKISKGLQRVGYKYSYGSYGTGNRFEDEGKFPAMIKILKN